MKRLLAMLSGSSECADPSLKRTFQVQKRCSAAHGAAMMVLEEVEADAQPRATRGILQHAGH